MVMCVTPHKIEMLKVLACKFQKQIPKLAKWGVFLPLFAGWMVWPAIPDAVKADFGLPKSKSPIFNSTRFTFEEVDTMPTQK